MDAWVESKWNNDEKRHLYDLYKNHLIPEALIPHFDRDEEAPTEKEIEEAKNLITNGVTKFRVHWHQTLRKKLTKKYEPGNLFYDFETALSSFAIDLFNVPLSLSNWFVNERDVQILLNDLLNVSGHIRGVMRYITAKSGAGKTLAALQIALSFNTSFQCVEVPNARPFDFPLLLVFKNNGRRCFSIGESILQADAETVNEAMKRFGINFDELSESDQDKIIALRRMSKLSALKLLADDADGAEERIQAHNQLIIMHGSMPELKVFGGHYMLFCMKHLLEKGNTKAKFSLKDLISSLATSKAPHLLMQDLLKDQQIDHLNLLVNIDEHGCISDYPLLRLGAFETLVKAKLFTTLGTDTKPMKEMDLISGYYSFGRSPLPMVARARATRKRRRQ